MSYRKFGDPPNRGDINTPTARRPIPLRDAPLPGTKSLDTPTESPPGIHFTPRTSPPEADFSKSAKTLGILTIVLAVVALICTGIISFAAPGENGALIVTIGVVAMILVHILAIISQTISRWRFSYGLVAVILWWGGLLGMVLLAIAIRRITAMFAGV